MAKLTKKTLPTNFLRILHTSCFIIVTFWLIFTLIHGLGLAEWYEVVVRSLSFILLISMVLNIPNYFKSKPKSNKSFQLAKWGITFLILIICTTYAAGWLADMGSVRCVGFFGVQESCVDHYTYYLAITLYHPLVLILLSSTLASLFFISAWQTRRSL